MRKAAVLLVLLVFLLSGCSKKVPLAAEPEAPSGTPEVTLSPDTTPAVTPSAAAPTGTKLPDVTPRQTPEGSAAPTTQPDTEPVVRQPNVYIPQGNYVFMQGSFVGCYADGRWISAADTDFSMAGLLEQERYYCYSESEFLGTSTEVVLRWDDGNWFPSSIYPEDGKQLIPYAAEYQPAADLTGRTSWYGYEEIHRIWFDLPCKLPEELRYITVIAYHAPLDFIGDHEAWERRLVMSSGHDPFPKSVGVVGEPCAAADIAAVAAELARLGIPGAVPNITEVYELDIDGDGKLERVIFANSKSPESYGGFLVTEQEKANGDSGVYYLALVCDGNRYDTLASSCDPYTNDESFSSHLKEVPDGYAYWGYCFAGTAINYGIYDINGDGLYEVCVNVFYLDSDDTFVFALDEGGKWQLVMNGFSGLP